MAQDSVRCNWSRLPIEGRVYQIPHVELGRPGRGAFYDVHCMMSALHDEHERGRISDKRYMTYLRRVTDGCGRPTVRLGPSREQWKKWRDESGRSAKKVKALYAEWKRREGLPSEIHAPLLCRPAAAKTVKPVPPPPPTPANGVPSSEGRVSTSTSISIHGVNDISSGQTDVANLRNNETVQLYLQRHLPVCEALTENGLMACTLRGSKMTVYPFMSADPSLTRFDQPTVQMVLR